MWRCGMGKRMWTFTAALLIAVLFAPSMLANSGKMRGTIALVTNHQNGAFSFGPLEKTNSATITATTAAPIEWFAFTNLNSYADEIDVDWFGATNTQQTGQSFTFIADPTGLGADITPGSFCVLGGSSTSLVSQPYVAFIGVSGTGFGSCDDSYGT